MPIRCPSCQHLNPAAAKYCNACGETVGLKACDRCDAVNDSQASLCHACGAPLDDASQLAGAATNASVPATTTSVLDAIATLEADLALLEQVDPLNPSATSRMTSASIVRTLNVARSPRIIDRVAAPFRAFARAKASPVWRPLLFASLMLAAAAGVVRSDQQPIAMHASMVPLAGAEALVSTRQEATIAGGQERIGAGGRNEPIFRKASASRSSSGAIIEKDAEASQARPPPTSSATNACTAGLAALGLCANERDRDR